MKYLFFTLLFFITILSYGQELLEKPAVFRPGHYYTSKGKRMNGLIAYKPTALPHIRFKKSEDAKPIRVAAAYMTGFVIESDTFAIIRDFTVEGIRKSRIKVDYKSIARVLEAGEVILYQCDFAEESYDMRTGHGDRDVIVTYILGWRGKEKVVSVPEAQEEFNQKMSLYFQNDQALAEKIRSSAYANRTIRSLVKEFNNTTGQAKP